MSDPTTPETPSPQLHHLQNTWTMWYDQGCAKNQKWGDHLQQIYTFSTVEDFWRLYNNMVPPRNLKQGCTYHLFKEGIRPEWEHEENSGGGKWVVIPDNSRVDDNWLSLLLGCIGETLCESEHEICGVIISVRKKQNKIAIWTKNSQAMHTVQIGENLKLHLGLSKPIKYQSHSDAANSKSPKSLFMA